MKTSLIEFFSSDSGIVAEKSGFSLGFVLVAILAVGFIFGTFAPVEAHLSGCPSNKGCGSAHQHGCCGEPGGDKYHMWQCCKRIEGGSPKFYQNDWCAGTGCH